MTWTGRDRRALGAVAMQFAVNGALFASFVPRLPEIRDQVDVTIDQLGLLLSASSVAGLIGSATVSALIVRHGTRLVIVVSAAMVSLSLSVVGVSTTWPLMLFGMAGMAAFDVYVDVAMNMQGSWLSARRRRPVMNRLHGLWSLGAAVGGVASSAVAEAGVSLRAHLIVAAAVLLAMAVVLSSRLLPADEHPEPDRVSADTARAEIAETETSPARPPTLGRLEFAVAGFCAVTVETAAIGWAAFRLTDDFGESAGFAAVAYVAVTVGMTAGRFAGDAAAHRFGSGRLLRVSTVVAAAGLAVAAFVQNRGLVIAGFAAAGLGAATLLPKLYDDAAKMPGAAGSGLGALTAGIRGGALAVPVVVGVLASTSLSVGAAIAVSTLPTAAGFLVVTRNVRAR